MILKTRVLVLNQNYEPINICNTKRAINLLGKGLEKLYLLINIIFNLCKTIE